ncbi:dinucleotide-utilizing enzyme possibly involved in molybdopterin or thiamin biosynthesis, partial [Paramagnetospirillum caucaseum]
MAEEAFARQALAFGEALNGDLRRLRVGVVGCGGTGSAVAMLLARLGVGQIALFDEDVVERTNLNRLHGARQSDADAMRPKVQAVAASIADMGLGVRAMRSARRMRGFDGAKRGMEWPAYAVAVNVLYHAVESPSNRPPPHFWGVLAWLGRQSTTTVHSAIDGVGTLAEMLGFREFRWGS